MDLTAVTAFLSTNTNVLGAVLISTVISTVVAYFFRVREHRLKLVADYDHEQRKVLRAIIGRIHGRILQAGNSLNYRMINLYKNYDKGWLALDDPWLHGSYYFHSTVCRFMAVFVLVREFERQALYVDSRIATKRDLVFLKYVSALHWCMTDVALFQGVEYDSSHQVDHFFSDSLRAYCDNCITKDGEILSLDAMVELAQKENGFETVFFFFHRLSPEEKRLRWDRLVSLHLLIATFINSIGYAEHRTSPKKLSEIASKIRNPEILSNLAAWLPRLGLDKDAESKELISVCTKLIRNTKT